MQPETDSPTDIEQLRAICAAARQNELNFAALLAQGDVVLEADRTKGADALKRAAKTRGGGAKGATGRLRIEGKLMILDCDDAPPQTLAKTLRQTLTRCGLAYSVETRVAGESAGADDAEDTDADAQAAEDPPASPAEEAEEDSAAADGDLEALLKALRTRPFNFAMLIGDGGIVLRTHRRRGTDILIREARRDGGKKRGAWGVMTREGRVIVLTCENEPPKQLARIARLYFRQQGHPLKVEIRNATGEVLDADGDDAPVETATLPDDEEDGEARRLKAAFGALQGDFRSAASTAASPLRARLKELAKGFRDGLQGGDTARAETFLGLLEKDIAAELARARKSAEAEAAARPRAEAVAETPEPARATRPEPSPEESARRAQAREALQAVIAEVEAAPPAEPLPPLIDPVFREAFRGDEDNRRSFMMDDPETELDRATGPFQIHGISGPMTSGELSEAAYAALLEFRLGRSPTPEEIAAHLEAHGPVADPSTGQALEIDEESEFGAAVIAAGGIWLPIADIDAPLHGPDRVAELDRMIEGLGAETKTALNARTDEAFYAQVNMAPGEAIPSDDHPAAETWRQIRRDVTARLTHLNEIPAATRAVFEALMPGVATAFPAEGREAELVASADRVLDMSRRLSAFNDSELDAFAARTGACASLEAFEAALAGYEEAAGERRRVASERAATGERIAGMAGEYALLGDDETLAERLGAWGYGGAAGDRVKAFRSEIAAFRDAFREDAVQTAREGLDRRVAELDGLLADLDGTDRLEALFGLTEEIRGRLAEAEEDEEDADETEEEEEAEEDEAEREEAFLAEIVEAAGAHGPLREVLAVLSPKGAGDAKTREISELMRGAEAPGALLDGLGSLVDRGKAAAEGARAKLDDPEFFWASGAANPAGLGRSERQIVMDEAARAREDAEEEDTDEAEAVTAGLRAGGATIPVIDGSTIGRGAHEAWEAYARSAEARATEDQPAATDPALHWAVEAIHGLTADQFGLEGLDRGDANARMTAALSEMLQPAEPLGAAIQALNGAAAGDLFTAKGDPGPALKAFEQAVKSADIASSVRGVEPKPSRIRQKVIAAGTADAKVRAGFEAGQAAEGPDRAMGERLIGPVCSWAFRGIKKFDVFRETPEALALLGGVDVEDAGALAELKRLYAAALREFDRLEAYVNDHYIGRDETLAAMEFWMARPSLTVDDIMDRLRIHLDEAAPVRSRRAPVNDKRSGSVEAPEEMMDGESREALAACGLSDRVAGTGGIEAITARVAEDGAVGVRIEGEPLAHRLERDRSRELKPGQSYAPEFNARMEDGIAELGLDNTIWNRLHLWGPGFGDEAAAGMFLGPALVNQSFQNSGIEDVIRQLSAQVAPYRSDSLRFTVAAEVDSWGSSSTDFELPNGERMFRNVEYTLKLLTPAGEMIQSVGIEMLTDPAEVANGAEPEIAITVGGTEAGGPPMGAFSPFFSAVDKFAPRIPK